MIIFWLSVNNSYLQLKLWYWFHLCCFQIMSLTFSKAFFLNNTKHYFLCLWYLTLDLVVPSSGNRFLNLNLHINSFHHNIDKKTALIWSQILVIKSTFLFRCFCNDSNRCMPNLNLWSHFLIDVYQKCMI